MDEAQKLARAAQQLLQSEMEMGSDFLPACRNPLPKPAVQQVQQAKESSILYQPAIKSSAVAAPTQTPKITMASAKHSCSIDLADFTPLPPEKKAAALAQLREKMQQCLACMLGKTRKNLVFGEGDPNAQLVFVGEAPGADEDETGRPFVGRAGQKLTEMINAMGLSREQVYIANILKCRPPNNRPPEPAEVVKCWSFLMRQLQIIAPKVIVTLGNPATQNLLQTSTGITKLRGNWQSLPALAPGLEGIPVMPTFHPSYVIRVYTQEVRKMVWGDLQKVMEKLGLKKQ